MSTKPLRVLIAKPGLDGHDVGAKIIVRALTDAGFEVEYTGLKKSPEEIVERAAGGGFDVLGLSVLSGSHQPICERVSELLREQGRSDLLWIVGGNIPTRDHGSLRQLGVAEVFSVGSSPDDIVNFIRGSLA